jgi:short-subunit dehydrogenase involved in D-alanine esterification of teichoic acids
VAEIEAAIAGVTRALARVPDEAVPMLVAERAAMRAELRALRETQAGNVVTLDLDRQ